MAKTEENAARKAREVAEGAVKAHLELIQKLKSELVEAQHIAAEANRNANQRADEREDLAARGDQEGADKARHDVALLMDEVNQATTRARGLARRLDGLEGETRRLCLAALEAWVPELLEDEREALALLDNEKKANLDTATVEAFVTAARQRYGCMHDLQNLRDKSVGQPSWSARYEVEKRGLLALAPSLAPRALKDPAPSPWGWLLGVFQQAVAA